MPLEVGSRLGPYEIAGPIGAGGMGEVYRARDTRLGREVAIKVLPSDLTRDRERLARFEREARAASVLNHRNIVTIHDFASDGSQSFLVMELIRGESLRKLLARGPIPMKKLLPLAAGIADGLAAAHAADIVHRDLKPENIMITADGTAKILDFGLVKHTGNESDPNSSTALQVSRTGYILGTAAYMSPEQASGERVDFRTDHFSLGLMLHEMATGKHPFRRGTMTQTLSAIIAEDPEPLGDELPESFVRVVERCLEKEPQRRYGSTLDLAHDLSRQDGSESRSSTSVRAKKKRWWPAVAAIAVLAAIAGAMMTTYRKTPAPAPPPIHATVGTPELAEVVLDEVASPVSISPDGRHLLVFGTAFDSTRGMWIHDLRSGGSKLLAENASFACWSPDSQRVAFIVDGQLKIIGAGGGPARVVSEARAEGTPAWNGNTILLVQYSKDPGIYAVSSGGGTPKRIGGATGAGGLAWWPSFLPDGKRFLFMTFVQSTETREILHEVFVGSLDGAPSVKVLDAHSSTVYRDGHLLYVRDGAVMAQPFDLDALKVTGEATPVVGGLHHFRNTGLSAFSVSDNGLLAWRSARGDGRLVWMDRSGNETTRIAAGCFLPDGRLSPDGKRYAIAVVDPRQGGADLWVYDLGRDSSERVTFRLHDEKAPVWAADGRALYYRTDGVGGPPDIALWPFGADRGSAVHAAPGVQQAADVSPDGKLLLYVDYGGPSADVKVLPLDAPGPPRPFIITPFNESSPRFSRDARWVAYESDISGRREVYVRPFEGTGPAVRVSQNGGRSPRWQRSTNTLYFLAPGGRFMTSVIDGEGNVVQATMLFQAAEAVDFEPDADGSRFLVQRDDGPREPAIHLLVNWASRQ
jgi:serine/threonine protein kinase/Tol biopolymer transport system component